jgi:hypothetical protein
VAALPVPLSWQWTCTMYVGRGLVAAGVFAALSTPLPPLCPPVQPRFSTTTITNPDGYAVALTFTSFETEDGFDYLYVYDGAATTAATLIGTNYTGTGVLTGVTLVSTGGTHALCCCCVCALPLCMKAFWFAWGLARHGEASRCQVTADGATR